MNIVILLLPRHTITKSIHCNNFVSVESLLSIYENMHWFLANHLWASKKLKEIISVKIPLNICRPFLPTHTQKCLDV